MHLELEFDEMGFWTEAYRHFLCGKILCLGIPLDQDAPDALETRCSQCRKTVIFIPLSSAPKYARVERFPTEVYRCSTCGSVQELKSPPAIAPANIEIRCEECREVSVHLRLDAAY